MFTHHSVTALNPLTGEVNNIDHLVTSCSILAFTWVLLWQTTRSHSLIIGWEIPLACFSRQLYTSMKRGKTASKSWIIKWCFVQQVQIGIIALLFKLICSAFTTELTHFSHWELPKSTQTFPTVRKYVSMTCFAPRRCFQFGFRCRARSRKCTLVLLLPGHRSQNTSYSRANVVTGV